MNDTTALKIFESCVNEMYMSSSPPISWESIKKKYEGKKKTFYDKHVIDKEVYERISEKYMKKLDTYYKRRLSWFLLDYAPSFRITRNKLGE